VPSAKDINALIARIDALNASVQKLAPVKPKAAAPVKATAPKAAAKKPAAKTSKAAAKSAAKKVVPAAQVNPE